MYDYIIIGAGPTGLTLAYELGTQGKKCLVLERQEAIGGCHRVLRVDGLFTEHAPRVYLSSYLNTIEVLKRMDIDFFKLFAPYKYGTFLFLSMFFSALSWYELLCLVWIFILFLFDPNYGKNRSVLRFMRDYDFSDASQDFVDRFCRVSDGAGSERFTVWEFLNLFNQSTFYGLYEPRKPNDVALFPAMKRAIDATHNVTFQLNAVVDSITMDTPNHVSGVMVGATMYAADNIIMAVPPINVATLCHSHPNLVNAFGPRINEWAQATNYNNDIAVVFHWDKKVHLHSKFGFPYSDWGLISIVMTDYMDFDDARSKTVISTCITYLDRPNDMGQTANSIINPAELVDLVFQQLCEMYPNLPPPTAKILSPTVYRRNGKWVDTDSAYFDAVNTKPIEPQSPSIPNLFQVGIQNGHGSMHATTFEAAVSNALHFLNGSTSLNVPIHSPVELRTVVWIVILVGIVIGIVASIYLWRNKHIVMRMLGIGKSVVEDNTEPVPFDESIFTE